MLSPFFFQFWEASAALLGQLRVSFELNVKWIKWQAEYIPKGYSVQMDLIIADEAQR
jgi:hypothetical protein